MKSVVWSAFFLLSIVLSCAKLDSPVYYENQVVVRAVASDQRVGQQNINGYTLPLPPHTYF